MMGIAVPMSSLIPRASGPLCNERMMRRTRFPRRRLLEHPGSRLTVCDIDERVLEAVSVVGVRRVVLFLP